MKATVKFMIPTSTTYKINTTRTKGKNGHKNHSSRKN